MMQGLKGVVVGRFGKKRASLCEALFKTACVGA